MSGFLPRPPHLGRHHPRRTQRDAYPSESKVSHRERSEERRQQRVGLVGLTRPGDPVTPENCRVERRVTRGGRRCSGGSCQAGPTRSSGHTCCCLLRSETPPRPRLAARRHARHVRHARHARDSNASRDFQVTFRWRETLQRDRLSTAATPPPAHYITGLSLVPLEGAALRGLASATSLCSSKSPRRLTTIATTTTTNAPPLPRAADRCSPPTF
ncbi:hypothetical protein E2C01_038126 [Portunus trituberculatus]|uniref:Uncharacterized protein n=1 Tax=Portunus trituberculatus TaxID=210409 RepID=A0A5B7FH72_PORTR|nr:hypothetical protein [Portunus trituberculatus]